MKSLTSGDPAGHRHLAALDGLRAVAFTAVFVHHVAVLWLDPPNWQAAFRSPHGILLYVLAQGWVGVDLFFVLSGFLITGILLKARGAGNYFQAFYARRALRIFPLYYIAVAAVFALPPLLRQGAQTYPWGIQFWYWLNLSNWPNALGWATVAFLTHFWTLSVEEQFYLAWPLLVRRCSIPVLQAACALAIAGEFCLRMLPAMQQYDRIHDQFFYRLTLTHSEGLFAGSLLALVIYTGQLGRTHLKAVRLLAAATGCAVLLVFALPMLTVAVQLRFTALAVFFMAIVALLALERGEGAASQTLSWKPFRRIGRYSYCMYVVHVPLVAYARWHVLPHLPAHHLPFARMFCAAAAYGVTFGIAALSWRVLEEPVLSLKRLFEYRSAGESAELTRALPDRA